MDSLGVVVYRSPLSKSFDLSRQTQGHDLDVYGWHIFDHKCADALKIAVDV